MTEKEDLEDYQVSTINDATFTEHSFDVIYCAYVLEHVLGVRRVLENFAQWIKPGGIIVLRIPDSRSVYAFIARYTSHWFHVLVKRHIYKHKNAGKLGYGPYPVVYEPEMSLAGIERFCNQRGFSMSVTANARYLSRASWIAPFTALVSALSFGVLRWRYSDLAIVIRA